jgi:AraC family transcriptional activator of pobA
MRSNKSETLAPTFDAYFSSGGKPPVPQGAKGKFNVFRRSEYTGICKPPAYNRRDYYKISLIIGTGSLHYADRGVEINAPALLLSNPSVPYSWEPVSPAQNGYFCVFTEDFITHTTGSKGLDESPLFRIGSDPLFFLKDESVAFLSNIYEKMLEEIGSEYVHKHDLLRNYVDVILHEALKLQPANTFFKTSNASSRIVSLFLELLERQFPIDSAEHVLKIKTAHDFAEKLSVHVNHLNRVVKEVTGKTTTEHIADRVVKEAIAMLKHTDWNIAEIAYCLGFEYPAYFNTFFKKLTGKRPGELRAV